MSENILFNFAFILLIVHEMDAVRCKEWRIFPGLNLLSDKLGFTIFIFAHVPIFGFLISLIINSTISQDFIIYLEVFFVIHLLLHIIYLRHPNNLFKDFISWFFIISPAILGLVDLGNYII